MTVNCPLKRCMEGSWKELQGGRVPVRYSYEPARSLHLYIDSADCLLRCGFAFTVVCHDPEFAWFIAYIVPHEPEPFHDPGSVLSSFPAGPCTAGSCAFLSPSEAFAVQEEFGLRVSSDLVVEAGYVQAGCKAVAEHRIELVHAAGQRPCRIFPVADVLQEAGCFPSVLCPLRRNFVSSSLPRPRSATLRGRYMTGMQGLSGRRT